MLAKNIDPKFMFEHNLAVWSPCVNDLEHEAFLRKISIKNFISTFQNREIKIPRKQLQVLFHVGHGRTTSEISAILNNSTTTIDSHIESLKIKTGLNSKSRLANFYWQEVSPYFSEENKIRWI